MERNMWSIIRNHQEKWSIMLAFDDGNSLLCCHIRCMLSMFPSFVFLHNIGFITLKTDFGIVIVAFRLFDQPTYKLVKSFPLRMGRFTKSFHVPFIDQKGSVAVLLQDLGNGRIRVKQTGSAYRNTVFKSFNTSLTCHITPYTCMTRMFTGQ